MSTVIDEKVVSMRFDNSQFEKNVKTSMSTLDKLKQKLNFKGASDSLYDMEKAMNKMNLSPLEKGLEKCRVGFSALDVFAFNALSRISNAAIDAGKNLVNSLAIKPVTTGFDEYELKMGSVQTIMASTGEKIETVNKYLEELNEYSDKTIYSFQDMTSNIGKFTNAGVKLEDAVLAIKGVSNEAAVSGANANEASRAMYNFAQALSAGYVKLIDWKSIENANMATVEFKTQLLETAVSLGTLTKTSDGMYETGKHTIDATHEFNDALSDQWMTTEVLVETLKKYASEETEIGKKAFEAATRVKTFSMLMDTLSEAAQSGWAQTWELIIGDYEEASKLWTKVSDTVGGLIDKMSKARNEWLGGALNSKWDVFNKELEKTGITTSVLGKKIIDLADKNEEFRNLIKSGGLYSDYIKRDSDALMTSIQKSSQASKIIRGALKALAEEAKTSSNSISSSLKNVEYYQKVVDKVWQGAYGNGADRVERLTKAGYQYSVVQKLVDRTVDGHKITTEDLIAVQAKLSDAELENVGYTKDEIKALKELAKQAEITGSDISNLIDSLGKPSGRELLLSSIYNIAVNIATVFKSMGKAYRDIFPKATSEQLYKIIYNFNQLTRTLMLSNESAEKLRRTFRGVFAVIDILRMVLGGTFRAVFRIVNGVLANFNINLLDATATIGDMLYALRNWIKNNKVINKTFDIMIELITKAVIGIQKFVKMVSELPLTRKIVSKTKEGFKEFADVMGSFIKRVASLDGLSFKNIKIALADFRDNVIGHFIDLDAIGNALGKTIDSLKEKFPRLTKVFTGFTKAVKNAVNNISLGSLGDGVKFVMKKLNESIAATGGVISGTIKLIKDGLSHVGNGLVSLFKFMFETGSNMTRLLKDVVNFIVDNVGAIATILTAFSVLKLAKTISGFTKALGALTDVFKNLSGTLKGLNRYLTAKAAKEFSLSVAILVGSIFVLSQIDFGKAIRSVALLGVTMAMLVGAMAVMSKINTGTIGSVKIAATIASVGIALLMMTSVMKSLSGMSDDTFAKGAKIMMSFVGMIAVLMLVSKFSGKNADKAGSLAFKVSLALAIMVSVTKSAAKIKDSELGKALKVMMSFLKLIVVLVAISKFSGEHAKKAGQMILKVSVAMYLMLGVTKIASKMKNKDLDKGISVMNRFALIIGALIAISKFSGEHAKAAGSLILKASASFIILAIAVEKIGKIKTDVLKKGLTSITLLTACLSAMMYVNGSVDRAGSSGSQKPLLAAIGAMVAVSAALIVLSKYDPDKILNSAKALTLVIGGISAMMIAMSISDKIGSKSAKSLITNLITIGAVLFAVTQTIKSLADAKIESYDGMGETVAKIVLGLVAGVIAISRGMSKTPKSWGALAQELAELAAVSIAAVEVTKAIGNLQKDGAMPSKSSVDALSEIILALVAGSIAMNRGISKFPKSLKAFATELGELVSIAGVGVGVYAVLNEINGNEVGVSIEVAKSFAVIVDSLGAAALAISAAGKLSIGSELAANSIIKTVGMIGGIVSAVMLVAGSLEEISNGGVSRVLESAEKVMTALGRALAGVFSGFLEKLTESVFDGVAKGMSTLATALKNFNEEVSSINVNKSKVDEAIYIGKEVLKLSKGLDATDFVTSVLNIIPFVKVKSKLQIFAESMMSYADAAMYFVKALDPLKLSQDLRDKVDYAIEIGKNMLELSNNIPDAEYILEAITPWSTGSKLELFSKGIKAYGKAMTSFCDSMTLLDTLTVPTKLQTALDIGYAMIELDNGIGSQGLFSGILNIEQLGIGETDLQLFSEGIKMYAESAKKFVEVIKEFPETDSEIEKKIETAIGIGNKMSDFDKQIESQGIFSGILHIKSFGIGETDLELFGDGINSYSNAIKKFMENIQETPSVTPDIKKRTKNAIDLGIELNEFVKQIESQGLISGILHLPKIGIGETDLELFSEGIVSYAGAISAFSKTMESDFKWNNELEKKSTTAVRIGKAINELNKDLPSSSIIEQIIPWADSKMESFGKGVKQLGEGIAAYSKSLLEVENVTPDEIKTAKTISEGLRDLQNSLPDTSFWDWFTPDKMSTFASGVGQFGFALESFNKAVFQGKYDSERAQFAIDTLNLLNDASLATNLDNISTFYGSEDLDDALSNIATALYDFYDIFRDVNGENLKEHAEAANAVLGVFKGTHAKVDITNTFKKDIEEMAKGIEAFNDTMDGISKDELSESVEAAKTVVRMTNDINDGKNGGLKKLIFGSGTSAKDYGENLLTFGTAIKDFSNEMTKSRDFDLMEYNADLFFKVIDAIPDNFDSKNFIDNLGPLGDEIYDFNHNLSYVKTSDINKTLTDLISSFNLLDDISRISIDAFVRNIKQLDDDLETLSSSTMKIPFETVNDYTEDYQNAGQKMVNHMIKGFTFSAESLASAVKYTVVGCITSISTYVSNFENAGRSMATGFKNGISKEIPNVVSKAREMASESVKAVKNGLDIHSPSRVFYKLGKFTTDGFVDALSDGSRSVYGTSELIGERARDGLSKSISKISDMLSNDINLSPTIRPVVDLSGAEDGYNAINSMFGDTGSMAFASDIGSINAKLSRNQNRLTNDDVVKAINKLGSSIAESGDTYTINGITYDDGSNISDAIKSIVRAARVERRI